MFNKKESTTAVDIDTTYSFAGVSVTFSKRKSDAPLFRIYPKRKFRLNSERLHLSLVVKK